MEKPHAYAVVIQDIWDILSAKRDELAQTQGRLLLLLPSDPAYMTLEIKLEVIIEEERKLYFTHENLKLIVAGYVDNQLMDAVNNLTEA